MVVRVEEMSRRGQRSVDLVPSPVLSERVTTELAIWKNRGEERIISGDRSNMWKRREK